MIVVLASEFDLEAEALTAQWPGSDRSALLTPADLSDPGWQLSLSDPLSSKVGLEGRQVPVAQLRGVLVRLPAVHDRELVRLVPEDRAYAAAEMTAFLAYWLSALPCPVLNAPSPVCLVGPAWRHEQWLCAAAQLGIPVAPVTRDGKPNVVEETADTLTVTVVGKRCVGSEDEQARTHARALASAAGVDLLQVTFFRRRSGILRFGHVKLLPPLSSRELRESVASYFRDED